MSNLLPIDRLLSRISIFTSLPGRESMNRTARREEGIFRGPIGNLTVSLFDVNHLILKSGTRDIERNGE